MFRLFSITVFLIFFWIILSGHYTPFLLVAGGVSCLIIALVSKSMRLTDQEGHPIHLLISALTYWPWLLLQIIQSALNVSRIIISPSLPISPTLLWVDSSQTTDVAKVTYANSITLTPGTITVETQSNRFLVHAITRENAFDLESGFMDQRCTRFERSLL